MRRSFPQRGRPGRRRTMNEISITNDARPILNERGAYASRTLDDGRILDVWPLPFKRAQLMISETVHVQQGSDMWDYDRPDAAVIAMLLWDPAIEPEPRGWSRHARSGRYRPAGDRG